MTTRSDLTNGGEPPAGRRRPATHRPRSRTRKAARARTLISGMLKRHGMSQKTVMICNSCELTGGPFAPGEAAHLLAVHQQLHHGALSLHRPHLPPVD